MSVIPKEIFKNIRRIQITTTKAVNDLLAGSYHSAFKGVGMEFEDVRAYTPGDEVRSIDWNVTARMNFPFVKRFREERELTVMLVVDVSGSLNFGSSDKLKRDFLAELGGVLAFSAIQNHDKVGLILFSDHIEKYIPPKKGVRHVLRVIRELLVFTPTHQKTDISEALGFLAKVQKKRGVCFLISDFITGQFQQQAAIAAKRFDLIAIQVTDPHEIDFPEVGLITLKDPETGKVQLVDAEKLTIEAQKQTTLSRIQTIRKLMHQIGASFIDMRTNEPYVNALNKFFKMREARRR